MSDPGDTRTDGFLLQDRQDAADLATYLSRARSVDPQAAVRLQGLDRVLAAWVSVIADSSTTTSDRCRATTSAACHDKAAPSWAPPGSAPSPRAPAVPRGCER